MTRPTPDDSGLSLPRTAADNLIAINTASHARFGLYDVYLTPDGGAIIELPAAASEDSRPRIPLQDAWGGLIQFLKAATTVGTPVYTVVSVGTDTLAHLYGQRRLTQRHLLPSRVRTISPGIYELDLEATAEWPPLTLRFSARWDGRITAGPRDA